MISPVATNDGFVQLEQNDYTELMTTVATKGPVAISVAAGGLGWQLYGGGVFSKTGLFAIHGHLPGVRRVTSGSNVTAKAQSLAVLTRSLRMAWPARVTHQPQHTVACVACSPPPASQPTCRKSQQLRSKSDSACPVHISKHSDSA